MDRACREFFILDYADLGDKRSCQKWIEIMALMYDDPNHEDHYVLIREGEARYKLGDMDRAFYVFSRIEALYGAQGFKGERKAYLQFIREERDKRGATSPRDENLLSVPLAYMLRAACHHGAEAPTPVKRAGPTINYSIRLAAQNPKRERPREATAVAAGRVTSQRPNPVNIRAIKANPPHMDISYEHLPLHCAAIQEPAYAETSWRK